MNFTESYGYGSAAVETRNKIRDKLKGHSVSAETRAKISATLKRKRGS